jgi:uncharacterized membrane protein YfcA
LFSFVEIFLLGIFFGTLSGVFGIGGGTILVPIMLLLNLSFPTLGIENLDMKSIIAISLVQMLISSIYGSYVNYKKKAVELNIVIYIGIGAIFGGFLSSLFIKKVSNDFLEIMFLFFIFFAFIRVLQSILSDKKGKKEQKQENLTQKTLFILVFVGIAIGFFSVSIGVGGSLLVVPILISFFNFSTRMATATGLFFVMFSSFSGVLSFSTSDNLLLLLGVITGIGSLIGVRIGIYLAENVDEKQHKLMLLIFYLIVSVYMAYRVII